MSTLDCKTWRLTRIFKEWRTFNQSWIKSYCQKNTRLKKHLNQSSWTNRAKLVAWMTLSLTSIKSFRLKVVTSHSHSTSRTRALSRSRSLASRRSWTWTWSPILGLEEWHHLWITIARRKWGRPLMTYRRWWMVKTLKTLDIYWMNSVTVLRLTLRRSWEMKLTVANLTVERFATSKLSTRSYSDRRRLTMQRLHLSMKLWQRVWSSKAMISTTKCSTTIHTTRRSLANASRLSTSSSAYRVCMAQTKTVTPSISLNRNTSSLVQQLELK